VQTCDLLTRAAILLHTALAGRKGRDKENRAVGSVFFFVPPQPSHFSYHQMAS
jgi:hypothetical protein